MARIFTLVLVLGLIVGGYLVYKNQKHFVPQPQKAIEVAPQRWQIATGTQSDNSSQTLVNASNATSLQSEGNASDVNASLANATLAGLPEDRLLTFEFVQDMASFLVSNYFPAHTVRNPGEQGRFNLNVKSANIRYGVDFPGMAVDLTDILGSRKQIFDHVLSGPVLEFLQQAYIPLFLDSLNQALDRATWEQESGKEMHLDPAQRKEMFSLLATKIRVVGQTIITLATSEAIDSLVDKYLDDMDKVNQAHMHFWELQGSTNPSPSSLNDASAQIKSSIQTREISRQRLLQTITTAVNPQGMDASELIYLAQWVHRRGQEDSDRLGQVVKAGEALLKTATSVDKYASQAQPDSMSQE